MPAPAVLGLISDTHGLLRPAAIEALSGVDHILHAGDIGRPDILTALASTGSETLPNQPQVATTPLANRPYGATR